MVFRPTFEGWQFCFESRFQIIYIIHLIDIILLCISYLNCAFSIPSSTQFSQPYTGLFYELSVFSFTWHTVLFFFPNLKILFSDSVRALVLNLKILLKLSQFFSFRNRLCFHSLHIGLFKEFFCNLCYILTPNIVLIGDQRSSKANFSKL